MDIVEVRSNATVACAHDKGRDGIGPEGRGFYDIDRPYQA
jgi:hypothetical protein